MATLNLKPSCWGVDWGVRGNLGTLLKECGHLGVGILHAWNWIIRKFLKPEVEIQLRCPKDSSRMGTPWSGRAAPSPRDPSHPPLHSSYPSQEHKRAFIQSFLTQFSSSQSNKTYSCFAETKDHYIVIAVGDQWGNSDNIYFLFWHGKNLRTIIFIIAVNREICSKISLVL